MESSLSRDAATLREHQTLLDEILGSGAWLRLVWESAPDAMVLSDPEGVVIMANPAYCELYGYTQDEVVGRSFALIFPPEQSDLVLEQYRAVFAGTSSAQSHEAWIRRKDGTERFVQARAEVIVQGGQRRALLSIVRDITRRKQAEEALRDQEERLEIALALSPVMLFAQDATLRYTWVHNPIAPSLASGETVGKTDAELLPGDEAATLTALKRRVVEHGEHVRQEIGLTLDGARIDIDFIAAPTYDDKGAITALIGAAVNVSEHRILERRQREFVAMAAHELRTPVTAIFGFAQLLRRQDPSNRAVATIVAQAAGLDRLIGDLSDVTRLESGRLELRRERCDLVALAREVAEQMQPLSAAHPIQVEAPSHPIKGDWDRDRLGQVLLNLLSNAVKYSPGGGKIRVSVEDRDRDAAIVVCDRGLGIAPELLPRLFDPFYRVARTERAARGLGLGLHIAKSLVEAHGGQIRAESMGDGLGSTFTVTLPRQPADAS